MRRAAHPVRTVKRAATPRVVKQAQRATHPVGNAKYSVERSLNTRSRSGSSGSGLGALAFALLVLLGLAFAYPLVVLPILAAVVILSIVFVVTRKR
jgi:Flp pilus assembly protein TadB